MFVSDYNLIAFKFIDSFDYSQAPQVTIIVGEEGLGKTTLLNSLLLKCQDNVFPTVLIGAQKFTAKYCYAACNGGLSLFRKYFRSSKLLLLDNINLLKGKTKTIEELLYTFDTILAQGGKAVITYGGKELKLDFLGDRLASRLRSGLVIRLQNPTEEEINCFAKYYLDSINKSFIKPFARETKIKNMKQVINIIEIKEPISLKTLEEIVSLVLPIVCDHFNVEEKKVLGPEKSNNIVKARYMVYLLLYEHYHYSYQEISAYFNRNASCLRDKSRKFKDNNTELFETLCQKMYNQEQ